MIPREVAARLTEREAKVLLAIPISQPWFDIGAKNKYCHELLRLAVMGITNKIHKSPVYTCDRYVVTELGLAVRQALQETDR